MKQPVKASQIEGKPWAMSIGIIGLSGTGKTSSIKNLPANKTIIFSTERKRLPFSKEFPEEWLMDDYRHLIGDHQNEGMLQKAIRSDKFPFIVIDSFTSWTEMLLDNCRKTEAGWDVFKKYNEEIARFLSIIKSQRTSLIFVTGIPDNIENPDGIAEKRLSVKGKEWAGKIEKEFTITLYTVVRINEDENEYLFRTQTNGIDTAKSPSGMFNETFIPNDLFYVSNKIREFYSNQ